MLCSMSRCGVRGYTRVEGLASGSITNSSTLVFLSVGFALAFILLLALSRDVRRTGRAEHIERPRDMTTTSYYLI